MGLNLKQILITAFVAAVAVPAFAHGEARKAKKTGIERRSPEKRKRIVAIYLDNKSTPKSSRKEKDLARAVKKVAKENRKIVPINRHSDGVGEESFDAIRLPEPKKIAASSAKERGVASSKNQPKAEIDLSEFQTIATAPSSKPAVDEKRSLKELKKQAEKEIYEDYF